MSIIIERFETDASRRFLVCPGLSSGGRRGRVEWAELKFPSRFVGTTSPICDKFQVIGVPMKKRHFVQCSAIFAFIFFACGLSAEAQTKYAVLVGVKEYVSGDNLNYPADDVESLQTVLLQIGYKPENIICLTSNNPLKTQPLKVNIDEAIESVLAKAKEGDTVIIFMSGHGLDVNGQPQFCPTDTTKTDLLERVMATTVSINSILKQFSECKATQKLMIVDACRNDPTAKLPAGTLPMPPLVSPPKGGILVQSCDKGETSIESKVYKRGIFSYALLQGLCGAAKDPDGDITLQTLIAYTTKRTQAVAKEHNHKQTPTMLGNLTDFVMVPSSAKVRSVIDPEEAKQAMEEIQKERQKLLAEARELLEAEIQKKIREEFRNANLNDKGLVERLIKNISSMIFEDAAFGERFLLLLGEERVNAKTDEEAASKLVTELIAKPVLQAYEVKKKEAEEAAEQERVAEAARQENAKEQQTQETAAIYTRIREEAEKIDDKHKQIEKLREIGVKAKSNKEPYGFYFISSNGKEITLAELDPQYAKFAKYLEAYEISPQLIDKGMVEMAMAMDRDVARCLNSGNPTVAKGARIVIHAAMTNANPDSQNLPFEGKDFEGVVNYIARNQGKLTTEVYARECRRVGTSSVEETLIYATGVAPSSWDKVTCVTPAEAREIMSNCYIFDRLVKYEDGTFKLVLGDGDPYKGKLSGQKHDRARLEYYKSSPNPYVKRAGAVQFNGL